MAAVDADQPPQAGGQVQPMARVIGVGLAELAINRLGVLQLLQLIPNPASAASTNGACCRASGRLLNRWRASCGPSSFSTVMPLAWLRGSFGSAWRLGQMLPGASNARRWCRISGSARARFGFFTRAIDFQTIMRGFNSSSAAGVLAFSCWRLASSGHCCSPPHPGLAAIGRRSNAALIPFDAVSVHRETRNPPVVVLQGILGPTLMSQ